MVRRYASFVVRCWHLGGDQWRFDVEHVQSDARTRVASMAAAGEWMAARASEAPAGPPQPPPRGGDGSRHGDG